MNTSIIENINAQLRCIDEAVNKAFKRELTDEEIDNRINQALEEKHGL